MITIDRMSLPLSYTPQVGDMLVITEMTGGNGKWTWKVTKVNAVGVSRGLIAWLLKRLSPNDAADFMLWCSTGRPLEGGEG